VPPLEMEDHGGSCQNGDFFDCLLVPCHKKFGAQVATTAKVQWD
jgi:hypothetical protein